MRAPEYKNWNDVGSNAWDATAPALEMIHLKDQDSAWASPRRPNLKKQTKYNKGTAQANAAGRGGHGHVRGYRGRCAPSRARRADRVRARRAADATACRAACAECCRRSSIAAPAAAAADTRAARKLRRRRLRPQMPTPAPQAVGRRVRRTRPVGVTVAPTEHKEGDPAVPSMQVAAQVHEPPVTAAAPAHDEKKDGAEPAPDEAGGEALPYWPALIPEFDKATHDFGWMRKVAVEFKKAQIDGKQKAVDTLAVYGRYKEYAARARGGGAEEHRVGGADRSSDAAERLARLADRRSGGAGRGEARRSEGRGERQAPRPICRSPSRAASGAASSVRSSAGRRTRPRRCSAGSRKRSRR